MGYAPNMDFSNQGLSSDNGPSSSNSAAPTPTQPDHISVQQPLQQNSSPSGKGGFQMPNTPSSGQPQMGQPNQYSNTTGDNSNQPTDQLIGGSQVSMPSCKGKGG